MDEQVAAKDDIDEMFARLAECRVRVAVDYLANEVQQTAAAVLLEAPPEWAADVLSGLPDLFRDHVLACMARSRPMHPAARHVVAKILEREFQPCRQVPAERGEQVRRLVTLMAPELREGATAVVDEASEVRWPAVERRTLNGPYPFAGSLPRVSPAARVHPVEVEHYESLPMLELVCDRLVRRMPTTLRRLTGENVEIALEQITSIRYDDYQATLPVPAMWSVFTSADGALGGVLVADRALTQAVVEPMLGGRSRADETMRWQPRIQTSIERDLFALAVSSMLDDLSAAFGAVTDPIAFRLDRLETNPRLASIAAPTDAMLVMCGRVDFDGCGGRWHLAFSHEALDTMRDALGSPVLPVKGRDQSRKGRTQAA